MASLTLLSELMNYDFSGLALDAPITDELIESVSGIRGLVQNLRKHIGGDTVTLADLAGHRATLLQGPRFVGTGTEVADQMEEWFEAEACDGFVVAATHSPGAYEDVVRLVVPELQRRGVFRDRYTGATLRDTLGLARPEPVAACLTRPGPSTGCGSSTRPRWPPARWWPRPWASSAPRSSRSSSRGRAIPCGPGATGRTSVGLVWKSMSRNKRCVTLDLRQADGQELFHELLDVSDVLVIGNRPSALARWGIDYESVHDRHPQLVMLHVSGYGRGGPKSDRPGFGTLAEAMSGFAHLTGQPDGPPTLPPFMLADGVAALAATYAVMMALYHRDVHGGGGQLVDVNLIEPLARLIESSTLAYDQLGIDPRPGRQPLRRQRAPQRLPDRRRQVAGHLERVAEHRRAGLPGHRPPRPGRGPRLRRPRPPPASGPARSTSWWPTGSAAAPWPRPWPSSRTPSVAAAPIYDAEQLLADEHLRARGTFVRVDDPDLGAMTVQAPVAVLTETPGRIDHLGRPLGADNDAVFGELLGIDPDRLAALRAAGVI